MNVATQIEQEALIQKPVVWSAGKCVAFRFCFVYFGMYCLTGLIGGVLQIPKITIHDPFTFWPFRQMVFWVAAHLFGAKLPLVYRQSGSGDKTFDWTEIFCVLVISLLATAIWSGLDRRQTGYLRLFKWFRLYVRFCLGSTLLIYAFDKLVPLQMPYPDLLSQLQPFSAFSPAGILWNSIGASPAYEIFAGSAEALGAVLLMFPRTVTLGALICLVDMTQVWMLNMTYDVPVKQYSFHLLLLSIFLLAPQASRLVDFFMRNRVVPGEKIEPLFQSAKANRVAAIVQTVMWLWILGMNTYGTWRGWHEYGGGRLKPPLYGIWDISQISVNGELRAPLLTDDTRWRRMIFDFTGRAAAQHLDDSFEHLGESIDMQKASLALTRPNDKKWNASFTFQRPAADQLILNGAVNGQPVQMQLKRVDESKFLFASRGFQWVQEHPFIR